MDVAITVALVAATTSLVIALVEAVVSRKREERVTQLKSELDQMARREERLLTARAELDRHREPLLLATLDLAHRIRNAREEGFLHVYTQATDARRRENALLSTLYRFARYWQVVEDTYNSVNVLRFERADETAAVASALRDIGRTFASDRLYGRRLMMWREEQRAVAELMRNLHNGAGVGYASFATHYQEQFSQWFADFRADLERRDIHDSERLRSLQQGLATLAEMLDTDHTYASQLKALTLKK